MKEKNKFLTRRELLNYSALLGLSRTLPPLSGFPEVGNKKSGLIVDENNKPGTTDWQLTFVRSENYRSEMIEGYCSHTSVKAGQTIDIFLSAKPATQVTIDVYRMGYYGGKGGRFIKTLGTFPVNAQNTPEIGKNRLRECKWDVTTSVTIPSSWVSGIYLCKLTCSAHRYQSYVIFIVRDERKADLLFQTSDLTWQAYNKWPDSFSLYDSDPPVRTWSATTWVSCDRPYGKYPQVMDNPLSQGSGEFLLWEYPLCYWLEENGYDVTYWANIDTHSDSKGLNRVKCFLSVGHDEYWSLQMYNNVSSAIQKGLNVAFLCGNAINGVIPLNQKNSSGRAGRIVRRTGLFGGISKEELKAIPYWATEPWEEHGPNESLLIGGRTMTPANGSANWIVTNEKHWIFKGTGLKNGDFIPGLVGWEHHGDPADLPGLEVIAAGKTLKANGDESTYAATVYPGPKGNWVFNAATIFWSMGLSQPPGIIPPYSHLGRPHGVDERVQKITTNFLNKCLHNTII